MKKYLLISAAVFSLLGVQNKVYAQNIPADTIVEKIIEIGSADNQTMKHLDVMTNRFGGRLLGSGAYEDAAKWALETFKKWGLDASLEYAGELPVGFNRGPWFGRMLGGNGMTLHFATPSYTAGTKGVQRGQVVREPYTTAAFEKMKGTINGAWVLVGGKSNGWPIDYTPEATEQRAKIIAQNDSIEQINAQIRRRNSPKLYRRHQLEREITAATTEKERKEKEAEYESLVIEELHPVQEIPGLFYKQMQDAGMLGIIQSAPVPITALYDRKNIDTMTWETLPELPDIKLDEIQFKEIADMVDRREYFQLEFDIRNHFRLGPIPYYNVVAVIPGTEHPEELVICCGHLDSYDVATGGVDCGTGIGPTMEAARLLAAAGAKPKRSIMFALWAGEEFGLLGSKYWVENNTEKLPYIVNVFNRDGGPLVPESLSVPQEWYEDMVTVVAPLENLNPEFPFKLNVGNYPTDRPTTAGGSDHAYFAMNGVPTIGLGLNDPKGYNFDYGEIWHTDRDLYNKSIPEYMDHTSLVNAIILWGIANMENRLPSEAVYKQPEEKNSKK